MRRAEGEGSTRRRAVVAAGACAVAVAAVVTLLAVRTTPGHPPRPVAATPPPVVLPSTATPRPDPAIRPVAPSAPTSFTLTGPAFTITGTVCSMANVRPYDPPGEQHHTICWVRSGFGDAPSSHQQTSYLFGHSWAEDSLEVLNKASEVATREVLRERTAPVRSIAPDTYGLTAPAATTPVYPVHALDGYRLVLRTHTGTLTYRIRTVYGVDKDQLGFIREWEDPHVRNRVVLTTCAELHGVDYDYNIVIEAYLVAAHPR